MVVRRVFSMPAARSVSAELVVFERSYMMSGCEEGRKGTVRV